MYSLREDTLQRFLCSIIVIHHKSTETWLHKELVIEINLAFDSKLLQRWDICNFWLIMIQQSFGRSFKMWKDFFFYWNLVMSSLINLPLIRINWLFLENSTAFLPKMKANYLPTLHFNCSTHCCYLFSPPPSTASAVAVSPPLLSLDPSLWFY